MSFKVKKTSTGHMGITLSFIKQLKSKERIMKKLLTHVSIIILLMTSCTNYQNADIQVDKKTTIGIIQPVMTRTPVELK